jgi:membrane protein
LRSSIRSLLHKTFQNFQRHKGQWLAAAIAYYMLFAIAPLIIVTVHIAGFMLGHHKAVLDEIFGYIQLTAGQQTANALRTVVSTTFNKERASLLTQLIGWAIFLVATVGLFAALQDALNIVWEVPPTKRGAIHHIRSRALAFVTIVLMAILLTISLAVNGALTVAGISTSHIVQELPVLTKIADFALSFVVMSCLLGFAFRFLPDCHVEWRDVWVGSAVTSLLFVLGQFLMGVYLGYVGIGSTFGTFTSIIVFLLWTNYSAQIILFGAEFTHVRAQLRATQEE